MSAAAPTAPDGGMFAMIPHSTQADHSRKAALVAMGAWALATGRGWLVNAVHAALVGEGLIDV